MTEPMESSPNWLKWTGLFAGPAAATLVYLLLPSEGLAPAGRATLAIGTLMAIWWLSEAIPLEATALIPLAAFPIAGVARTKAAAAPYVDEVIFLFMGGMMLGVALERWNVHKRVALWTMLVVGTRPGRLIGGMMLATAIISMWVSNTATAVMMLPIAAGIVGLVRERLAAQPGVSDRDIRQFATCLMLGVGYAATIGGVATLIGTPPNAVLKGYIERVYAEPISFDRWLWIGMPLMLVFLPISWLVLTRLVFPVRIPEIPGAREMLRAQLRDLGPMVRGERLVLAIFALTSAAWIFRPQLAGLLGLYTLRDGKPDYWLSDTGIAIMAALAMFLTPVDVAKREFLLDWRHAGRMPWGVLLLFGGGLSLAAALEAHQVDVYIGALAGGLSGLHPLLIILIMTTIVVFVTEVGSNTAVTTTFLPIATAAALRLHIHPFLLAFPVAIGASYAFMMPTGTPPNALVFATGLVRVPQMWRAGIVLNILSIVVITSMMYFLGPWLLGFDSGAVLAPAK